jgi:DegV family protein with EDD domain
MNTIQIVTDSTAYIPKELMSQKQIKVVSLNVHFEGESFEEGYPDSFEAYYKRLAASMDFPKTSQPSSESFQKVFEEALAEGKEVIAIVISEKLSGTHNSAYAAAQMTEPEKISIIDSESTAANLRALVEMACQWAEEGMSREDIVSKLEEQKQKMSINLTVGTLEYLKRGGRLTGTKAVIATVLDIRPILALVEGKLVPVGKGRGKTKTIEMMIKDIPEQVKQISVCHTANYEEAFNIMERLKEKFAHARVQVDDIGPVIGSHLGPGAIGICSYW